MRCSAHLLNNNLNISSLLLFIIARNGSEKAIS
jgi:hypothetical protein